jgi:hypothetical protein
MSFAPTQAQQNIKTKHILFFSNDQMSRMIIDELDKYPSLKKQFVIVDVNNQQIVIPEKVRIIGHYPLLFFPGFEKPIEGPEALTWLQNGGLQGKANGLDYGSFNDVPQYSVLVDESKRVDGYNRHFNEEYNRGFGQSDDKIKNSFSSLTDNHHIEAFGEDKKTKESDFLKKLDQRKAERDADLPAPIKRIGGLGEANVPTGNQPQIQSQSHFQSHSQSQSQSQNQMQMQMQKTVQSPALPFSFHPVQYQVAQNTAHHTQPHPKLPFQMSMSMSTPAPAPAPAFTHTHTAYKNPMY